MTDRTIRNANINLRPLLWNNLPTEIKSAKSYESFKNRFKKQHKVISRCKSRLVFTRIYFFIPFVVNIAFLLL